MSFKREGDDGSWLNILKVLIFFHFNAVCIVLIHLVYLSVQFSRLAAALHKISLLELLAAFETIFWKAL